MIKHICSILKLIHLHLGYLFVGLDEEYFYISRANCFTNLGWYNYAIGNYKKAMIESKDPHIKSALGYCYIMVGDFEKSVKYYREAYENSSHPDIALGLACAEMNNGNTDEGKKILEILSKKQDELDPYHINELNRLKHEIEIN